MGTAGTLCLPCLQTLIPKKKEQRIEKERSGKIAPNFVK
jgi:hypothetical protein